MVNITDDNVLEDDKSFTLSFAISAPPNFNLITTRPTATITITNDDSESSWQVYILSQFVCVHVVVDVGSGLDWVYWTNS